MLSTGGMGGTGRQRPERSKPIIGSLFSNESNNLSMATTTMFKSDAPSTTGNMQRATTGNEISFRHSSNENLSYADPNSDANLKHISFAIIRDGIFFIILSLSSFIKFHHFILELFISYKNKT